jgi:hypothetical protein
MGSGFQRSQPKTHAYYHALPALFLVPADVHLGGGERRHSSVTGDGHLYAHALGFPNAAMLHLARPLGRERFSERRIDDGNLSRHQTPSIPRRANPFFGRGSSLGHFFFFMVLLFFGGVDQDAVRLAGDKAGQPSWRHDTYTKVQLTLSRRTPIEFDAAWCAAVYALHSHHSRDTHQNVMRSAAYLVAGCLYRDFSNAHPLPSVEMGHGLGGFRISSSRMSR